MTDLSQLTSQELFALHTQIMEMLRKRGIIRSSNNPTGDFAEYLFCRAFAWHQMSNSNANIDAVDTNGIRYQIKARQITRHNNSRQLSALRDLDKSQFDFLAGVLFREDYSILRAAIIPYDIVVKRASMVRRTNSHKFFLRDDVWDVPGVRDVTDALRAVKF